MKWPRLPEGPSRQMAVVMVGAGLLLALYINYGVSDFAARTLGVYSDAPITVLWQFVAAFLLLFLGAAALWRFGLSRPLSETGVTLGDARFGLKFVAVTLPLLVLPLAWLGSRMPDVRAEYPLARAPDGSPLSLLWLEGMYLLYYVGWEYFFRGFLILGIRERTGDVEAVGLSMLVTTAIHLGKPEGEVWGAVLVGIVFGWLVIRTRSILWPLILHVAIGLLTDLFVLYGPGGST